MAAVAFPQVFTNPSVTNYGVFAMIYVTAAIAWNIFSGNTGYISLGQAVFFGSGAYAMGIAAQDWHINGTEVFALLPLSGAVGALIAVPFGLIALRVRRHTFIVITIAVFFIFQLMAFNFWFTGGTSGLNSPFLSWPAASYNTPFYYIALAFAVGSIAIAWLVRRSRFGLQLRAIRDDEDRARGLGVKAMRVKLTAFVISGAITAMIGAVWFYYSNDVHPQTGFNPLFDLTLVLMAFLGGYGSISGPVLGALIIETLTLWLNTQPAFTGSLSNIMLGAVFLLVVLFLPRGIIPTGGELITKIRTRGRPAVSPAAAGAGPGRGGVGHPAGQLGRCPVTTLLRTEGIMKAYGGVQALNGATIAVEEGTVAGLIGPNGSGKTTLFNVITGYERPDAGEVWFGGHAITGYSPDKVFAAGIGRTFQLTRIFPRLTVIENMLIAAQARDRPRNLLARLGRDAWTQHRRHATELLEFVGIERHASVLAGLALLRPAQAARARLRARRRPGGHPARRAGRRGEPDADQPDRRPHQAAQRGAGQDVPARRAQHGVRHGAVLGHHGARVGRHGGERPAGHRADGQARARRVPRRGPRRGRGPARPARETPARKTQPGTGGHPMSEPLLAMDGVVAGYGGGDVLRGVSFAVPAGQHHLRGGAERRGQVDRHAGDQRPAPAAARHGDAAR